MHKEIFTLPLLAGVSKEISHYGFAIEPESLSHHQKDQRDNQMTHEPPPVKYQSKMTQ
jgi:hypothetical protein